MRELTQILCLIGYFAGLAEGQRVVFVRQLSSRAGELHSLVGEERLLTQQKPR